MLTDLLPYILEHKGRTFVVVITPEMLRKKREMRAVVTQLCVMRTLDIRLLLIVGTHAVNDQRVSKELGATITKKNTAVRCYLEQLFSVSAPRAMGGRHPVHIVSGNFATARPKGIIDGVSAECAGVIRSIDVTAIERLLTARFIVSLTSSLYSVVGGEPLVVDWLQLARMCAAQLRADKIILLHTNKNLAVTKAFATTEVAQSEFAGHSLLHFAKSAAMDAVPRVHLVYGRQKDSLLIELFSQGGKGLLISRRAIDGVERATTDDLGALLALIRPYETAGVLTPRRLATLEDDLSNYYYVLRSDISIIACGAMVPYRKEAMAEIACLVVTAKEHHKGLGSSLLAHLEQQARQQGMRYTFCLTTQASHWFIERGYSKACVVDLPIMKQKLWNSGRNSDVFIKNISQ